MILRRAFPSQVWLAIVAMVAAFAALSMVVLLAGGVGDRASELAWGAGAASSSEERAGKVAEEREQRVLREVWGLPALPEHPRRTAVHKSAARHTASASSLQKSPPKSAHKVAVQSANHAAAVERKRALPVRSTAAAVTGSTETAVAKPAPPRVTKPAPHVAANVAEPALPKATKATPQNVHFGTKEQERIDATLRQLQDQAMKLGVRFKETQGTQLDDLPIPDLEHGSTTPDIPFPSNGGAGDKGATQALSQDPSAGKFEHAGINVYGWNDEGLPDRSDHYADPLDVYPTIQFAESPRDSTLYAPAWSPDYLEPARHAPTDHAAWAWMAHAKALEQRYEEQEEAKLRQSPEAAAPPKGVSPSVGPPAEQAGKQQALAELSSSGTVRCPWYGCADGSGSLLVRALNPARTASARSKAQARGGGAGKDGGEAERTSGASSSAVGKGGGRDNAVKVAPELKDPRAAAGGEVARTLQLLGFPADGERVVSAEGAREGAATKLRVAEEIMKEDGEGRKGSSPPQTQQLLAHGYGTGNAYKADPITAPHDQFYGGDSRFFGSRPPPVPKWAHAEDERAARHRSWRTRRHRKQHTARHVRGHEAFAADGKTPVYDLDEPHSFDSVPLASPSSFLSRVAAHFPGGYDSAHPTSPGKLQAKVFRGQVLADWRKYEHGLTKCLEAEATIDPNLRDYSCADVSTGLTYLRSCMENHAFGLASLVQPTVQGPPAPQLASAQGEVAESAGGAGGVVGEGRDKGAWAALPELVQQTYKLHPKDYETVYSVLSNSAVFSSLWNMERLHARCAATGSAVKYRPRGSRVQQIDSEIKYLDRLLKWWNPGTPEMQKGEAIIQGAYRGLPWEHASQARGAARNYWTYTNSRYPDASAYPNLPSENQFYGPETGYMAEDWAPSEGAGKGRAGLPRWRVPGGGKHHPIKNPAGNVGSLGDYTMQQPRAKLEAGHTGFPVTVNGNFVDPGNPRPWQADKGAYNPWTGYYWTGPGKYDAVPEAHPMTQYSSGYNYPTTVKPEVLQPCEEDVNCPAQEVCSTGGFCRKWEAGRAWYVPANGGIWRSDSGVAESWV
jgi:hypothetical protein